MRSHAYEDIIEVHRPVDYIDLSETEQVPGSQQKGDPDSPELPVEIPPIRVLERSHKVPQPNINRPANIISTISFFAAHQMDMCITKKHTKYAMIGFLFYLEKSLSSSTNFCQNSVRTVESS